MPVTNGVFTPLTLDTALNEVIAAAPASIQFSPGNPPELVLANMFAQADVLIDENNGEIMALMMSPVGSMIDTLNPNNPRNQDIAAIGYVVITNGTATAIPLPANTIIKCSTGQTYTTGSTALIIPGSGNIDVPVTSTEAGAGGNISSGQTFSISGISSVTITNPLPFLSGADAESDAVYLNRLISEKTEYGTQNGSVAVETELKKYYQDARIYVNNTNTALTSPVPVPINGYNLVVRTPNGVMAQAAELNEIFKVLSNRLEFVNAQNAGSTLHVVRSGTIYNTGVPQNYYSTISQPITTTLTTTINVRASRNADRTELISQANDFAVFFITRLTELLSGIQGDTNIIYSDSVGADVTTAITIPAAVGLISPLAPAFGIATIQGLVSDIDTMEQTPQIVFDSVASMSVVLNPDVVGEDSQTLSIGGAKTFIDFENDILFSDDSSWYDRFVFINPGNLNITIKVAAWI